MGEPAERTWSASAAGREPPAVGYGAVFVPTGVATVGAYDIETGEQLWECDVGSPVGRGGLAVAEQKLFGGNNDGQVFAIDAETGEIDWRFSPHPDRMT